ncbi:MAG: endonuclease/exonuclease/phosphatase family protein [Clostridia bacterium]|nr:endonuclease/exonuclease/phosphatase family protein [Clostridia bacterium]
MSVQIKVMTFNLRVRNPIDGANFFDLRRDKILDVIRSEKPDIIGFQEATDFMNDWLKGTLEEYYVLGHGRGKDYHGEGTPIAYRKDLFDLHSFREEWLSFTPEVPASVLTGLDQSKCPRVCVCAELVHKDSSRPFAFFNMHTDHRGEQARVAECVLLAQKLGETPYRFVVTGDFNAYPDSTSIQMLLANKETLGIVDATKHIKGSFHAFKGDVGERKIDYIFTNLPTDASASYAIPDDDACGCYYSDHNALCSFVSLE